MRGYNEDALFACDCIAVQMFQSGYAVFTGAFYFLKAENESKGDTQAEHQEEKPFA